MFLKPLIKKLFYRIYLSGHAEAQHRCRQDRANHLQQQMEYDADSVRINNAATILNHRKDKKYIKVGKNCLIRGEIMVLRHGGEVIIGEDCFLGDKSRIWSSVKISIGNRVLISHNVNIHDNISHPLSSKERHLDFLNIIHKGELREEVSINEKEIIIEDDVWIGFNATILKGVKIGRGAIIGANTIVTKDVEPYGVVVGNPNKIIKYTD